MAKHDLAHIVQMLVAGERRAGPRLGELFAIRSVVTERDLINLWPVLLAAIVLGLSIALLTS